MSADKEFYWTRLPGKIIDKHTGKEIESDNGCVNIGDWYKTLIDLIFDNSSPGQDYMTVGKQFIMPIIHCSKDFLPFSESRESRSDGLAGCLIRDGLKKQVFVTSEEGTTIEIISASTLEVTRIFVEIYPPTK